MRPILGRDPALIASAVGGIVALLGSIVFNWGGDTIGVVNAALAALLAVYVAWGTYDTASAAILQLTKALLVLGVTFGADITADQTALVIVAVEGVVGAFMRTQLNAIVPPPAIPAAPGSVPVTEVR